ncbi:hypothetical protein SLEP1_g43427 [Rubroshorea leprosula]|uniref:Secreted protein n=1 Tax=Rubroshorea leprosula TaxID=152421 RepID=A0AAV5LCY7_9ROSI|nr:hypothetical protein SLEP1_g43427 [Rubroshorea leprosula]
MPPSLCRIQICIALFFSLVRRVLLGLNPLAFSVCHEFPLPGSRRLPHQPSSGSAGWNSGFDRSVTVALGLAFSHVGTCRYVIDDDPASGG